jgi:hypothetical protein
VRTRIVSWLFGVRPGAEIEVSADRAQRLRLAWRSEGCAESSHLLNAFGQAASGPARLSALRSRGTVSRRIGASGVSSPASSGRRSLFGAFAEGIRLSWSSGLHLRRLLSYAALDLPLTLRNNVLPQFGQALRAEAAVFSSWVASHLEHA